jgi:protein TonB
MRMKHVLTIGILMFATCLVSGQDESDSLKIPFNCSCKIDTFNGQEAYAIVEKMPEYPTGAAAMLKLIRDNMELASDDGLALGSIYLSFVIDTAGNVTNKCIQRPYHPNYLTKSEKSALKALDKMEKWIPGEQNGVKVPVKYNLPIRIEIR